MLMDGDGASLGSFLRGDQGAIRLRALRLESEPCGKRPYSAIVFLLELALCFKA
jgi:hypothetical protein